MRALDLFSGIGGFALGFERAGIETAAFCEVDTFCREWLAQQWPGVPIYHDVRVLDGRAIGFFDIVCGGFPCQDISAAGAGAGLDGARSGLWFDMLRIVREVRPTWVVIENVPALRTRGADRVLDDLEASNYSPWPFVVGADDVGAPQRRKRAWIIARRMADADRDTLRDIEQRLARRWARDLRDGGESIARDDGERVGDADSLASECGQSVEVGCEEGRTTAHGAGDAGRVADTDVGASEQRGQVDATRGDERPELTRGGGHVADAARYGDPRGPSRQRVVDVGRRGRGDVDERALGETCGPVADAEGRGQRADRGASWGAGYPNECRSDVAYGNGGGCESFRLEDYSELGRASGDISDRCCRARPIYTGQSEPLGARVAAFVGDADGAGLERYAGAGLVEVGPRLQRPVAAAGVRWPAGPGERQHGWEAPRTVEDAQCRLGAAADGLPAHMGPTLNRARLKGAGNSVLPIITECIGRVLVGLTP